MQLTINGEACTCAEGLTVAALLREREHDATAVVVEHNGQIVPAADFASFKHKANVYCNLPNPSVTSPTC